MKITPLSLILLLSCSGPLWAADGDFIQEFWKARQLEKTDPAGAAEGLVRSFRLAVAERNLDYTIAAGGTACARIYQQGRAVEAGRLARETIDAVSGLGGPPAGGDAVRLVPVFGYLERGLLAEGRIGEAWRANRAAAMVLRGQWVPADGDGPPIAVSEVLALHGPLRGLGWRLLERQAELLDVAGRTLEAKQQLDEAAVYLEKNWQRLEEQEVFYAGKVLGTRAMILDFLGYEEAAIQAQQRLLDMTADRTVEEAPSRLTLQMNLLRNLSQWEGPTEARLEEARAVVADAKKLGPALGMERLLAKMELALHDSAEALAALRSDAELQTALGRRFDALYANRDSLVARAGSGEEGLDAEFVALLDKARAQGNKRSEPSLYREYGEYLTDRNRPAEAVPMLVEALRLTRSFGWTLHEPSLLSDLFEARMAANDPAGARAVLAELEAFLQAHPEMPLVRRVRAEVGRAMALAALGQQDAAKEVLAKLRRLAKGLPEYQKRWLTAEAEAVILKSSAAPGGPAGAAAIAADLRVQPLGVTSVAAPGGSCRTRFSVANPGGVAVAGHWEVSGPGAVVKAGTVRFKAGEAAARVEIPRRLSAGDESWLELEMGAAGGVSAAEVQVIWKADGGSKESSSVWQTSWDPATLDSVVLDASSLESNPFRALVLFHEIAAPVGEETGVPFRLRSPIALRVEYYDPGSKSLLAVDANGNGDFTEAGDLHARSAAGALGAIVPVTPGGKDSTVEVRLFAPNGEPLPPASKAVVLEAEAYRDGKWVKDAEDILR